MTWLIGGLCTFVAATLLGRWFLQADPRVLAKVVRWVVFGGALALALFILLSGRFALLLPIALLALPFVRRWLTQGRMWPRANPSPGQTSSVDTEYLEMTLDHDSGHMSGRIKRGAFAGHLLEELSRDELMVLLREFISADPEAAQLVEAYLDRMHDGWRDESEEAGDRTQGGDGRGKGAMTQAEAYEILGLQPGASDAEVRDAHHRLMLKIHPDQGGSTYLATKINQAKEILLGS